MIQPPDRAAPSLEVGESVFSNVRTHPVKSRTLLCTVLQESTTDLLRHLQAYANVRLMNFILSLVTESKFGARKESKIPF